MFSTHLRLGALRTGVLAFSTAIVFVAALLSGTSLAAHADSASPGGLFHALTQRVLDTRTGNYGFPVAKFSANSWHSIPIAGQGGIPGSNVSAAQVTFTVANQAAAGVLHADKTGVSSPNTTVPFVSFATSTTSNTAVLPLGSDGKIQVQMTQTADLLIDVQGYYTGGNAAGGGFVPTSPTQIFNSGSSQYAGGQSVSFNVAGVNPIPSDASSVMLDIIEANGGSNAGYLTAYPFGEARPLAALNWPAGRNFEWTTAVPLNSTGKITIAVGGASGSVNLSVGVEGYFTAQPGSSGAGQFTTASARVYNSTSPSTPLASGGTVTIPVAGVNGLPIAGSGINAAAANVEIISGSGAQGHVEIYADDVDPGQSAQQFYAGQTTTVFDTVALGADGGITVQNSSGGTINVIVDVEGWYSGGQAPTISCPQPYAAGSWTTTIPTSDITCTISAPQGDPNMSVIYGLSSGDPVEAPLSLTAQTTETVIVPATGGVQEIDAYITSDGGDTLASSSHQFGLGNWATGAFSPFPGTGNTESLTPSLAVTDADQNLIPSDATYTYTITTNPDGISNPTVVSNPAPGSFSVPSGDLNDATTYYWTAQITGSTDLAGGTATVTTPVWSFTTNASTPAPTNFVETSTSSQHLQQPDNTNGSGAAVRGFAINHNRSWQLKTELDGGFCDRECELTDVVRTTWTITPGRYSDRFTFKSTYVGGNFKNIYATLYALCGGIECGQGYAGKSGPEDGSGSGSPLIAHGNQAGGKTIDQVQMQAFFKPKGSTYYDNARTGTASCKTGSNRECVF